MVTSLDHKLNKRAKKFWIHVLQCSTVAKTAQIMTSANKSELARFGKVSQNLKPTMLSCAIHARQNLLFTAAPHACWST